MDFIKYLENRPFRFASCAPLWRGTSLAALALLAAAGARAQVQTSFYEFGKVVAIGQRTIDLQVYDAQRQRTVQHSFTLTRESRADIVRMGDAVEVVYAPEGGEWAIRRMIVLTAGYPTPGEPSAAIAESARAVPPPAPTVPARDVRTKKAAKAQTLPVATPPTPAAPVVTTLGTGVKAPAKPAVVAVSLGSPAEAAARAAAHKTRDVAITRPAEECNRSSEDWPSLPLRIAVLDFRYPTEREESHDVGTTGGGSGTAVADLVFARLDQDEQGDDRFAFSRGDRRRLERSDFAGAARVGRQLGVDAVLAGTFVPVENVDPMTGESLPPKAWELRQGIVDTCTGQLLLQTSSVACAGGMEPGVTAGASANSCSHFSIPSKATADPKDHAQEFKSPLDALLFPLEHDGKAPGKPGSAGVVTYSTGDEVVIQLAPHSQVKAGDQLALHASRLAKNPSTYTLHNLQNEEIGRMTVKSVQGSTVRGAFTGDFPPRAGDAVDFPPTEASTR